VKPLLMKVPLLSSSLGRGAEGDLSLDSKCDRRKEFTPVRNQAELGSCTSFAASGLIQYMQKQAFGSYTELSTRFIYKVTRNLLKWTGDTGAFLRTAMGTLTLFGAPPEEFWLYNGTRANINRDFDQEPSAFCYAFGQNYQAIKYVRLDQPNIPTKKLAEVIKKYIQSGLPSMFGFTCYESLRESNSNGGQIPFPNKRESVIGGHAVVIAGYDDGKEIKNPSLDEPTVGAFLIKNSWSTNWGEKGFGWLPYEYVYSGEATDFWTVISEEWVNNIQFGK
jgi:C1A family cysteine protease